MLKVIYENGLPAGASPACRRNQFIFVEEGLQLLCMDLFYGARCQLKQ